MKVQINRPEELGQLIRANRKSIGLRQDDTAGSIGVSENFLGKVERGGETVQWGKLFQVLKELGLTVTVEVPEQYAKQTLLNLDLAKHRAKSLSATKKASQSKSDGTDQ